MKTLIELFPALASHKLAPQDPRWALLDAPVLLAGDRPVRHPALSRVIFELFSAVKASPLTFLIGVSGVGKTRLVLSLVERLNRHLSSPGRIPAVYLVAPTPQRKSFTWKGFWERFLTLLEDPLPQLKIDPHARAEAARNPSPSRMRSTTEYQYFEIACSAAAARGLAVLVIDEATALVRSEDGVTLVDQIEVLRELADRNLFRIVLVSHFAILPHVRHAGVLDRRKATVVFPRYPEVLASAQADATAATFASSRSIDPTDEGFVAFVRSAHTFMQRLPDSVRLSFTSQQFEQLYRGSLGCVGLLHDWFLRAIAECVDSGEHRLVWDHFAARPLPLADRANLILEARTAEQQLVLLRDLRLDLTEDELLAIADEQAKRDRDQARRQRSGPSSPGRSSSRKPKSGRKPGVPNAKTVPLA